MGNPSVAVDMSDHTIGATGADVTKGDGGGKVPNSDVTREAAAQSNAPLSGASLSLNHGWLDVSQ